MLQVTGFCACCDLRTLSLSVCIQSAAKGCNHFYSSSGGNAGLAAAYCASQLKTPITVIVPETAPQIIRDKLAEYGAEVRVHGKVNQLPTLAIQLVLQTV